MPAAVLKPILATLFALSAGGAAVAGNYGVGRTTQADVAAATSQADEPQGPLFRGVSAPNPEHSFYFTRAVYGEGRGLYRDSRWATDVPDADLWIINVLDRLTDVDIYPRENYVELEDPDLRKFPFIYALEMHGFRFTDAQVENLREYLLAGGFLMVDDFWGPYQLEDFAYEMNRVLPGFEIVELPMDHELFSSYYKIDQVVQVPNIGNGIRGGPTHQGRGSEIPHCFGIFDDNGRLMVVVNWNTDIGDAWEHAEDPRYPLRFSTYAYQIAANTIVYAMTH